VGSRIIASLLSLIVLVVIWELLAGVIDSRLLPPPTMVFAAMAAESRTGALPYHLAITLLRVAAAFVLAMAIGFGIGLAMGRSALVDKVFDGWLVLLLNLPALVVVILFYVWFGLTEVAAVAAVAVNKIPTVVVTVREGARALDPDYLAVARVFRFGRMRTFRHVIAPQLTPYVVAAARSGLSLIWKIVLVVELLGRSDGVGFQLSLFFQLFDVTMILAYTLAFVIVIQLLELAIMQPLERRISRWRQ
jgi:NitT/TauT family transport system permease protein